MAAHSEETMVGTQRQDARRNRETIIRAARQAFVDTGMNAPAKAIARAAGLGSATLYRHFPTRSDLMSAVFNEEIARCRSKLAETRRIPDVWEGLRHLLRTVVETEIAMPGLAASLSTMTATVDGYDAMWTEAREAVTLLWKQLHTDGELRTDVTREDFWLLIATVRATAIARRQTSYDDTSRLLTLIVEGLRSR